MEKPMIEWLTQMKRISELEYGCAPRYVTMNWENFYRVLKVNPSSKNGVVIGCMIFINPCISNELVSFSFERTA